MTTCCNCKQEIYNPYTYGEDKIGSAYYEGFRHQDTDERQCADERALAWPYASVSAPSIPEVLTYPEQNLKLFGSGE